MRGIMDKTFQFWSDSGYKLLRNAKFRTLIYLLVERILSNWPLFAKPIHQSVKEEERKYYAKQESVRNDVERMVVVLQ